MEIKLPSKQWAQLGYYLIKEKTDGERRTMKTLDDSGTDNPEVHAVIHGF